MQPEADHCICLILFMMQHKFLIIDCRWWESTPHFAQKHRYRLRGSVSQTPIRFATTHPFHHTLSSQDKNVKLGSSDTGLVSLMLIRSAKNGLHIPQDKKSEKFVAVTQGSEMGRSCLVLMRHHPPIIPWTSGLPDRDLLLLAL